MTVKRCTAASTSEIRAHKQPVLQQSILISGNLKDGSITHLNEYVHFALKESGKIVPRVDTGNDPLSDTFKRGAQALLEGRLALSDHS